MKHLKLLIYAIIIIALLSGCDLVRVKQSEADKSIVAKVDGENISKEQFDKMFEVFKTREEMRQGPEVWEKTYEGKKYIDLAKEHILEQLIQDKIQLNKADELKITVTQEEVDAEVDKWRNMFDSDEKFKEFLETVKMDEEYFIDSTRKDLIINKLKENMTENAQITEEEIAVFYSTHMDMFNRVKASHILLETEEEAQKILEKVKAGENFNSLAKEYSIDPSAKENNGDLGYLRHGDTVESFEAAAFALKPGEISDIVKSQYGYHIIKVEDKKVDKLEDVKDELRASMLMEKKNEDYNKAFQEMYSKAKIEKFVKNL